MTSDSRMREILAECLSGVEFRDVHEESALEAMRRVRDETIEEMRELVLDAIANCGGWGEQGDYDAGRDAAVSAAHEALTKIFDLCPIPAQTREP
jgi:acetone carboxylase gamma subunit